MCDENNKNGKLKILLVDDEPFILQGLTILIDWTAEGCEIVKTASNGMEALNYLKKNCVDVIIADIKMPVMSGIELLKTIREEAISDAYFIILSGFNDFKFAQQAIRYLCMDYILKPVKKEELLSIIREAVRKKQITVKKEEDDRRMQKAYTSQNLTALLCGQFDESNLLYVKNSLLLSDEIRYIHICLDDITALEELTDDEIRRLKTDLCENCRDYLGEDSDHLFADMPGYEEEYEIGFVFCSYMASGRGLEPDSFLQQMWERAEEKISLPVVLLVGKKVDDISKISISYSSACSLRSFRNFRECREVYYYEKEGHVGQLKTILCKQSIDLLLNAVEKNDRSAIDESVDSLFQEMERLGMQKEVTTMNTNYLLFQLAHLAVEQDESVNQEEVMLYISENVFDSSIARGSRIHLKRFAREYADYLIQLRKNVSRGVLQDIEREIRDNYAQNLTLRELSRKYFINSSYLGQIFRKKYNQSFKDYLCSYRINEAAQMLLKTDKKISQIAEDVGYHDSDYFINRFIEQKGCTPSRYRKSAGASAN